MKKIVTLLWLLVCLISCSKSDDNQQEIGDDNQREISDDNQPKISDDNSVEAIIGKWEIKKTYSKVNGQEYPLQMDSTKAYFISNDCGSMTLEFLKNGIMNIVIKFKSKGDCFEKKFESPFSLTGNKLAFFCEELGIPAGETFEIVLKENVLILRITGNNNEIGYLEFARI